MTRTHTHSRTRLASLLSVVTTIVAVGSITMLLGFNWYRSIPEATMVGGDDSPAQRTLFVRSLPQVWSRFQLKPGSFDLRIRTHVLVADGLNTHEEASQRDFVYTVAVRLVGRHGDILREQHVALKSHRSALGCNEGGCALEHIFDERHRDLILDERMVELLARVEPETEPAQEVWIALMDCELANAELLSRVSARRPDERRMVDRTALAVSAAQRMELARTIGAHSWDDLRDFEQEALIDIAAETLLTTGEATPYYAYRTDYRASLPGAAWLRSSQVRDGHDVVYVLKQAERVRFALRALPNAADPSRPYERALAPSSELSGDAGGVCRVSVESRTESSVLRGEEARVISTIDVPVGESKDMEFSVADDQTEVRFVSHAGTCDVEFLGPVQAQGYLRPPAWLGPQQPEEHSADLLRNAEMSRSVAQLQPGESVEFSPHESMPLDARALRIDARRLAKPLEHVTKSVPARLRLWIGEQEQEQPIRRLDAIELQPTWNTEDEWIGPQGLTLRTSDALTAYVALAPEVKKILIGCDEPCVLSLSVPSGQDYVPDAAFDTEERWRHRRERALSIPSWVGVSAKSQAWVAVRPHNWQALREAELVGRLYTQARLRVELPTVRPSSLSFALLMPEESVRDAIIWHPQEVATRPVTGAGPVEAERWTRLVPGVSQEVTVPVDPLAPIELRYEADVTALGTTAVVELEGKTSVEVRIHATSGKVRIPAISSGATRARISFERDDASFFLSLPAVDEDRPESGWLRKVYAVPDDGELSFVVEKPHDRDVALNVHVYRNRRHRRSSLSVAIDGGHPRRRVSQFIASYRPAQRSVSSDAEILAVPAHGLEGIATELDVRDSFVIVLGDDLAAGTHQIRMRLAGDDNAWIRTTMLQTAQLADARMRIWEESDE